MAKFMHVVGFIIIFLAMIASAISLNLPETVLYSVVGLPAGLLILFALTKVPAFIPTPDSTTGITRSGTEGNDFDDIAIRPDEAWDFVNKRIKELNDEGKAHPFRKINTDRSDIRKNKKVSQERVFFKIDGRRTQGVVLKARPKTTAKYSEMLYYLIDLKAPDIADYKGDLEGSEARDNPFKDKYDFYHERGGDSEPKQQNTGPEFHFNQGGQEEGA